MKKILIKEGRTGFFGYHLCKNFLKLEYKVYRLSKTEPKLIRKLSKVKYLLGDISIIKSISFLKKKFLFQISFVSVYLKKMIIKVKINTISNIKKQINKYLI